MKNQEYTLYLDMDGVLVDFENGYKKIPKGLNFKKISNERGYEYALRLYNKWEIKFWSELDWIHGGKELWNASKNLFETVCILSSSGTGNNIEQGKIIEEGKRLWIKKNIPEMSQDNVYIVSGKEQKQLYSNKRSILIDDVSITIKQWNSQGGYGILHDDRYYKYSIEDLEDISRPIKLSELSRRFLWK